MVLNCLDGRRIFNNYDRQFKVFSDMVFLNDRILIEGNRYFRAMDRDYPGSFFIYNTRSMDRWVNSRLRHAPVGSNMIEKFKHLYGTDDADLVVRHWIAGRQSFEAELNEYFGQSSKLLILDIESEDPGGQIARFLGMDLNPSAWRPVNVTGGPRPARRTLRPFAG